MTFEDTKIAVRKNKSLQNLIISWANFPLSYLAAVAAAAAAAAGGTPQIHKSPSESPETRASPLVEAARHLSPLPCEDRGAPGAAFNSSNLDSASLVPFLSLPQLLLLPVLPTPDALKLVLPFNPASAPFPLNSCPPNNTPPSVVLLPPLLLPVACACALLSLEAAATEG
jgi:hypothetical protein